MWDLGPTPPYHQTRKEGKPVLSPNDLLTYLDHSVTCECAVCDSVINSLTEEHKD